MLVYIIILAVACLVLFLARRQLQFREIQTKQIIATREKKFKLKQDTFVEHISDVINGIYTQLWRVESSEKNKNGKRLIYIMIPGNPGISSCYVHWMQIFVSMFMNRDENKKNEYDSICVYLISQANHCSDPLNKNKSKIYLLNDQINHKYDCIKYIISQEEKIKKYKNCKYIIGGHSIGSFMVLKALKKFDMKQFEQIHLWAPTIINIAQSNNGIRTNILLKYGGLYLLEWIQSFVTNIIPEWFIFYFALQSTIFNKEKAVTDIKCKSASVLTNILSLANNEFKNVLSLNETGMDKLLQMYSDKLVFYWAKKDGWAHQQCQIDIKNLFNKKNDDEMKEIVVDWIVDENAKHALMIDDLAKNVEEKLSKLMISWIEKI